jgi:hypothetical protein
LKEIERDSRHIERGRERGREKESNEEWESIGQIEPVIMPQK